MKVTIPLWPPVINTGYFRIFCLKGWDLWMQKVPSIYGKVGKTCVIDAGFLEFRRQKLSVYYLSVCLCLSSLVWPVTSQKDYQKFFTLCGSDWLWLPKDGSTESLKGGWGSEKITKTQQIEIDLHICRKYSLSIIPYMVTTINFIKCTN